ncbi:MAG: AAA family ATPase [Clostridia bacterium]
MKKLYIIGGTMGVGKTTVCQQLKKVLAKSVFLDGDCCWDMQPFVVNEETKAMVIKNICFLLNQFLHCSVYENIIFCWVLHQQDIIDTILNSLDTTNCELAIISLLCNANTLNARLDKDIREGIRSNDVIERSVGRIPLYDNLSTEKIITDGKSVDDIVKEIVDKF